MNRTTIYTLLLSVLSLLSCGGHQHGGADHLRADSLCMGMSLSRYSDIAKFDSLAMNLFDVAGDDNEMLMVATNAKAYSAMMRMEYGRSVAMYRSVLEKSECEIERLVADVGLMTVCYRVSANRLFFDYRASAISRIRRINEEYDLLMPSDKERFNRARVEFNIVSVCYFSNLAMQTEAMRGLEYLERNMESADDRMLRTYARMILANNQGDAQARLRSLTVGLGIAENNDAAWLEGNHKLLLAIALRDSSMLNGFVAEYPDRVTVMLPHGAPVDELPSILAGKAVDDFVEYGDRYMAIEAMAVQASCEIRLGRFDAALSKLSAAYDRISDYYAVVSGVEKSLVADSLLYCMESDDGLLSDIGSGVYNIPECLLSICREASCAYAGIGDKEASDINREAYLELLRTTRLNKKMESRTSTIEAHIASLKVTAIVALLMLAVVALFLFFVYRRRVRKEEYYSAERKRILEVCRMLLSSLPHDICDKEQLFGAISELLNANLGDFASTTRFVVSSAPVSDTLPYITGFNIRYVDSEQCDVLSVASELPIDNDRRSLVAMLVPYIAVAIEEGLRLAGISEEREKVEEMKRASAIYLAEHKRENVLKRVSVSVVSGMRPFMDRISNELRVLAGELPAGDKERKLGYVSELTGKLDDLNVILERWIKTRQGELNLKIENFAVADIFAIIEKNRQLLEARGLELAVADTDMAVKADRALTLFMINTLVENAAKFTPEGGRISVECTAGDGYAEISVTDTGIGLSQGDIDRILGAKVYDASLIGSDNELLQPKRKGGGFGLMNSKGIIEKYRKTDPLFSVCSFDISSTKGKGSRFSFRLPKGVVRLVIALLSFVPAQLFAHDDTFERLNACADSVFMCNVNGEYEKAMSRAAEAMDILNAFYGSTVGGTDTLSLYGGTAAELAWWRQSLFPDSLKENIYYNILDIRNEVAIASLVLNEWDAYRYNNFIYSTLYRLVHEDKGIADRYATMQQVANRYEVTIALACFLILVLLIYYVISFVRHNIIEKTNERLVLEMNGRLLRVAAKKDRGTTEELAQDIVDEFYACLGETMRIRRVAMLLDSGNGDSNLLVETPGTALRGMADVYMSRVLVSGEPVVVSGGLLRVVPLYAVNEGERMLVGVLEVVTGRPLSDNEVVSLELVTGYLASVAYHSAVRVANGYMALEELEEEAERMRYEENRLHVQNMVMDNCLSVIKHETVYYPSRIRELAEGAMAAPENAAAIDDMRELMGYYSSVFGILSNCAVRELDGANFMLSRVPLSSLFVGAKRFAERAAKRAGLSVTVVCEQTDAVVNVDADLAEYLFEQLLSAAMSVAKDGMLLLRAADAGEVVRVELVDNRRELTSDEVASLFTPGKHNIIGNGVDDMEYLVAKEIVRLHEDFTGKHGGRMEARSDVSGTVILFTLPK